MNRRKSTHHAEVIDLAALSRPARRVVDIYDQLTAGKAPKPGVLDQALSDLDAAPHPTGQLGEDINLLASGGLGGTRSSVIAAIERLRRIATVQPDQVPPKAKRRGKRRRKGRTRTGEHQLQLPGITDGTEPAA